LEVSSQVHANAALPLEKEPPVPIGWEAGWATEPVWTLWRREHCWPYWDLNSDTSVFQPVASRYTDYAIPAPSRKCEILDVSQPYGPSWPVIGTALSFISQKIVLFIRISNPKINKIHHLN
jgi:hypothetical protein